MEEEILELVQRMVMTDSTQRTTEVAEVYAKFLSDHGFDAKLDEYEEGKANVMAKIGPSGGKRIIISGHMDTVPIGDPDKWINHPFSGKVIDGELWGRGSVDMKGGTGALAGVMVELQKHESELQSEIVLAATADEEVGLGGARKFAEDGIMQNVTHVLIAEPTGLGVAVMEKGAMWAKIKSYGKQAHGSRPDLGHNAIEGLVKLFPDLYAVLPDISLPEVGKSSLNIGVINGGSAANVVPEYAEVICDYRFTPGVKNESVIARLKSLLESKSSTSLQYELEITDNLNAPPIISSTNDFAELLATNTAKYTQSKPKLSGMYYATDGAAFLENSPESAFAIFGPGSTELLHQTNERLSINELSIARKVIFDTMLGIAL